MAARTKRLVRATITIDKVDYAALGALAHSAMAIDVYSWLASRLHRVPANKPQFVPWAALHAQFGFHYERTRDFRRVFLGALRQVKAVYPDASIGEELNSAGQPTGLTLYTSHPPVNRRT